MYLRRKGRALRSAGALGMVLAQFGAAAALPAADAVLDAARVGLPTHIESPHNESCPASHDHIFCQVVRSLAAVSAGRSIATVLALGPPHFEENTSDGRLDAETRALLRAPTAPRPPPLG